MNVSNSVFYKSLRTFFLLGPNFCGPQPEIAHEIRNQYTLAYSPLNMALDGTFRKITVTVNAPGRPNVRSRNGYYANAKK